MSHKDQFKEAVDQMIRSMPDAENRSDPTTLADIAWRRAIRRRKAVRIAIVGVAVAAVAGTFPLLQAVLGSDQGAGISPAAPPGEGATRAVAPKETPAATPKEKATSPGQPPKARSDVFDLDTLPLGDPPEVPWYADGAVHIDDLTVPFDSGVGDILRLERVDGGFVILAVSDSKEAEQGGHHIHDLVLLSDNGEITTLVDDGWLGQVALTEDGSAVAWSNGDWDEAMAGGTTTATLGMADTATGRMLAELATDLGPDTSAVGFLDRERVLLDVGENKAGNVAVWGTRDDTIAQVGDLDSYWVQRVSRSGRLAVVLAGGTGRQACPILFDLTTEEPDMKLCGSHVGPFSRDEARLVSLTASKKSEPGVATVEVIDLEAGEPVFSIKALTPFRQAWEPDGDLLFEAWQGDLRKGTSRMALVRCDVAGECELATEPRESEVGPWDSPYRAPYVLPR